MSCADHNHRVHHDRSSARSASRGPGDRQSAKTGRVRANKSPPIQSAACAEVERLFGVDARKIRGKIPRAGKELLHQIIPAPGGITFITGPSGAGKTSLLRQLRGRLRSTHRIVEMNRIRLPARAMVDCFEGLDIAETLQCLSRVGLADVSCYVRKPSELSLGQRWRLRLAMAMQIAKTPDKPPITVLICDEFTALLDRVTACVVARSLRRCIGSSNVLGALVASSHDDLLPALQPDVIAHCDFGKVHTYHSRVRS